MATEIPYLRHFDIYMPFEFLQKCAMLNGTADRRKSSWSAHVREMTTTDCEQHQNFKRSKIEYDNGFEQRRFDNFSKNVQIVNIQTCMGPENMLLISLSEVHLQVLEGRCGFWLSNVEKNEAAAAACTDVVSSKHSEEVADALQDRLITSILTSQSNKLVDQVEFENKHKTSGDRAKCSTHLDSNTLNTNIVSSCPSSSTDSINANASTKQKNTAESGMLKQKNSSLFGSGNSLSYSDSNTSPSETNFAENILNDKHVGMQPSQTEIDIEDSVQEHNPSTILFNQETASNNLSRDIDNNDDNLLQFSTVDLAQERKTETIRNFSSPNPKKQHSQQDESVKSQRTDGVSKVNDSNTRSQKYMLRGVRVPKCLIEQEKNTRLLVSKNKCKNQKIKRAKVSCKDIEYSLSYKDSQLTNDESESLSTSENPVSPSLSLISSKKQPKHPCSVVDSKLKRRKRNNTKVVQCRYCKKMFCDYTGVDEHVKKFHTNEANLVDYIGELKILKVVNCDKCNVTLQNRYLLQEHEDHVHSTTDAEVCSICGKNYKNQKSLRNHTRFVHHSNGQTHLCNLCPAKFKWAGTLKQHIQEVHEGIKAFKCPTCNGEFSRKSQLNRHIRIHGSDASKRITCALCDKGFWFENNYLRHMKTVHEPQSEEFHCSFCGKGFNQKASMVAHVQLVHLKIYTYTCNICKVGFTRSKLLQGHMAVVHNKTDFAVKDKRQNRLKYSRTAADLLHCHYCDQGFYYKAQVVEHIHKEHTFPHRCDQCKQGFVLKKFLDNHMRKAHGLEIEVSVNDEDENNDTEQVLENLLELKSESAILPNYITDSITTLENSEGIPGENLLTPDTECFQDLLKAQGTDTYEVSTSGSTLLLEVAKGCETVHYFVQHDDSNEEGNQVNNNKQVIEDITSLLLVAEEASSKESLPVISEQMKTELVKKNQSEKDGDLISNNTEAVNILAAEKSS